MFHLRTRTPAGYRTKNAVGWSSDSSRSAAPSQPIRSVARIAVNFCFFVFREKGTHSSRYCPGFPPDSDLLIVSDKPTPKPKATQSYIHFSESRQVCQEKRMSVFNSPELPFFQKQELIPQNIWIIEKITPPLHRLKRKANHTIGKMAE